MRPLALTLLLLLPPALRAQAPLWQWIKGVTVTNTFESEGRAVCLDRSGNLVFAGWTESAGSCNLNGSLPNPAFGDLIFGKMDPDGNLLWFRSNGGNFGDYVIADVAVDADNNIYIGGHVSAVNLEFDALTYDNDVDHDPFVAKFDSNGEFLWVRNGNNNGIFSNGTAGCWAMSVSDSGDVFVTGNFFNTLSFPDTSFVSQDYTDGYVVSWDKNGNWRWGQHLRGVQFQRGQDLDIAPNGDVLMLAQNTLGGTMDGVTIFAPGAVVRLDALTGDVLHTRQLVQGSGVTATTLAAHPDRGMILSGEYGGPTMYAGTGAGAIAQTPPANASLMFLARYDSLGNVMWLRSSSATQGAVKVHHIQTDASGNAYIAGTLSNGIHTIGADVMDVGTSDHVFVSQWDDAGNALHSRAGSSAQFTFTNGYGLTHDGLGHCYVTGNWNTELTLQPGLGLSTTGGNWRIFVSRINFPAIEFDFTTPTLCNQGNVSIPYTTTIDFQPGNQFIAELSDATGNFSTVTVIGMLTSNVNGSIPCSVPAGLPAGSGYRIRIHATNPAYLSSDNGADISIQENVIALGNLPAALCPGKALTIPFSVACDYANGNGFTAEISDAAGSFASPFIIGTLTGTGSGAINGTVPAALPPGSGYHIRIRSSNLADTSASSGAITVHPTPAQPTISLFGTDSLVSSVASTYQWTFNGSNIPGATQLFHIAQSNGNYTVITTDANGCEATSAIFTVTTVDAASPVEDWQITAFPNPNSGAFVVEAQTAIVVHGRISLSDAAGRCVFENEKTAAGMLQWVIDENLPPGIYPAAVWINGNLLAVKKIVVTQ